MTIKSIYALKSRLEKVRTTLELERFLYDAFEKGKYEKKRAGIDEFINDLEHHIPRIGKKVSNLYRDTGKGILELLEDKYRI